MPLFYSILSVSLPPILVYSFDQKRAPEHRGGKTGRIEGALVRSSSGDKRSHREGVNEREVRRGWWLVKCQSK